MWVFVFFQGKVVKVYDGDTITILTNDKEQVRIRLHGIDAPEKKQDFGNVSQKNLADMCAKETAEIKVKDTDKYGRVVGIVYCRGLETN